MAHTSKAPTMKRRPAGTGLRQAVKVSNALVGKLQKRAERRAAKKGGGR